MGGSLETNVKNYFIRLCPNENVKNIGFDIRGREVDWLTE
jgi:hypothetical protein|tara:strand:+ start:95710 stop:95829 length:120 start_codon:yes stop_codon:yes gene_type:complete